MPIDPRHPREIRRDIRDGKLTGVTAGFGQGYVQANLAVLPQAYAYDFLLFCQRNPKPCPLIEVTDVGSVEPVAAAPGADLRADIAKYRIYEHGELTAEVSDAREFHGVGWDPAGVRRSLHAIARAEMRHKTQLRRLAASTRTASECRHH